MADRAGPDPNLKLEDSTSIIVCPKCSWPVADEANVAGIEAKQLADVAKTVTHEMSQLLVQLAAIMAGFKQAVANGGQEVDGELGTSLGAILIAVEQVRDEMEKVASLAVATSSARLARITEALRLDVRSLMQAKNKGRGSI